MRKVALICAATVVGALGITAVASAIQGQQTVSVALQNNRAGTKSKPRSVSKLTVTTGTTIVPGEAPWAATAAHDPLRQEPRVQLEEVPDLHRGPGPARQLEVPDGLEGRQRLGQVDPVLGRRRLGQPRADRHGLQRPEQPPLPAGGQRLARRPHGAWWAR